MRKGMRKHGRVTTIRKVSENLTMTGMFERFTWFKQSQGQLFVLSKSIRFTFNGCQIILPYFKFDKTKLFSILQESIV